MEPINESDLPWTTTERGGTAFRRKKLAAAAGDDHDLGCSLYELPPGKRSWPYHYHTGNAEALYVLAGRGLLRAADDEHRLRPGDYVSCPVGEAGAHRVVNDGDEPLRYLALSTMREPDVTVYPDSGKVGVYAGSPPGGEGERDVSGYYDRDATVDYWAGEE
ncbi:cupin domain-containing protein [Halolamina sp. C58]|uniref:cupin domain-containing protein n=1 Tax=Halolamina sp. C58 TaxID=3421640 RepID=UPI003EBBD9C4